MKLSNPLDDNLANCIVFGAYPIVCDSLKSLLDAHPKVGHVYTISNVVEAKQLLYKEKLNLLVLDVDPPLFDGLDFVRQVRASGYKIKVLFFSSNEYETCSREAEMLGAIGYVSKLETMQVVARSLDMVLNGYRCFKGVSRECVEPVPTLSVRETTVLKYLMSGKTNKDISNLMSLSPKTISTYKTRILRKYDASSIIEIMKMKAVC